MNMTFLGVLIIVLAIILFLLLPVFKKEANNQSVSSKTGFYNRLAQILSRLTSKSILVLMLLGALISTIPYLFFWAEPGYQYFVVSPTGSKGAIMTEGIKWRGFAQIIPWQKYIDVKVVEEGESTEEIEGAMKPIPIRFIDQVTAKTKLSTRFQLPTDEQSFIDLAIEFRSLQNLVHSTLVPTVREVVSNTGYMFAAQDYISGSASDFRVAIDDQLKFGTYSVQKTEFRDTIVTGIKMDDENRKIKEIRTRYDVKKRTDSNGKTIRIAHDINENQIIVVQVIVDDVILEETFKKRLEAQRDESAKRQLEQQKIKTAKDAQARIVAEGERDKAAERVTQEKEQVKALIAIETKLKQEETNKKLAEIALQTERLKAEAEKVKADAEAYKNKKLVSAGLTPQERAQIEKETAIGVASHISRIVFPQTMIIGGDGKGATPLESLIGAGMAKQLMQNGSK
tara:strand:+ start:192 stop:1556 length:1365 start_codon:yes stop_codon:yes gene_type:complete